MGAFWRPTDHFVRTIRGAHDVLLSADTPDDIRLPYRSAVAAWAACDGASKDEYGRLRIERITAVRALGRIASEGPPLGENQPVEGVLAWDMAVQVIASGHSRPV